MKFDERFPRDTLPVLAHFYRGEVHKATIWRQRMDATTNWAILATTATFSWAFTAAATESHFIFPFATMVLFLLLLVEARRYRYYDVWRNRMRMLEVHLMVPALNPEQSMLEGDWRTVLSNDLLQPSFKMGTLEAIGRRLHRNYIWLFLLLLAGWSMRVYSGADADSNAWVSLSEFVAAARYRFLSPLFVLALEGGLNLIVLVLYLMTLRTHQVAAEIRRKDRARKQWPI